MHAVGKCEPRRVFALNSIPVAGPRAYTPSRTLWLEELAMIFFRRFIASILCLAVLNLSSPLVAEAGMIGTLQAVESQHRTADLATVNSALARDQVRAQLGAMGVDATQVDSRVAARAGGARGWPRRSGAALPVRSRPGPPAPMRWP